MKPMESLLHRAGRTIEGFAFAPASAMPLAVLRVGLAASLLVQAVMVAPALLEIYSRAGILQGSLKDHLGTRFLDVNSVARSLAPLGIAESSTLIGVGVLYLMGLVTLLVGYRTRIAAVVVWFVHAMWMMTMESATYGADAFADIFLFYLMWVPAGDALSLDRALGRRSGAPTSMARLGLRVVQIHLCIAYLAGGIEKATGAQWWNGEAVWRSLMISHDPQFDFSWLAQYPWVAAILGWTVLVVEIGYAALIWPRYTRRLWVAATVAMHIGIAVFMGLGVFSAIMMVLTIAAFGVSSEPPIRLDPVERRQTRVQRWVAAMR